MEDEYKIALDDFADRLKNNSKETPIQEVRPIQNHSCKVEHSDKIIRATVHLPVNIHTKIKIHCASNGISFKDYVTNVLSQHIESLGIAEIEV